MSADEDQFIYLEAIKPGEVELAEFEVDRFIETWLTDVFQHLERERHIAADDLLNGDEAEQQKASERIAVICGLLSPPLSAEERNEKAEAVKGNSALTTAEKIAYIDAILHPKRKRGRPQTETVQNAIDALSLYRKGKATLGVIKKKPGRKESKRRLGAVDRMDWREIAKKVIGCKHNASTATLSCQCCADAIERAVSRLNRTLKEIDRLPTELHFPRTFKALRDEISELKS